MYISVLGSGKEELLQESDEQEGPAAEREDRGSQEESELRSLPRRASARKAIDL